MDKQGHETMPTVKVVTLIIKFSSQKQPIFDQTRQNGDQTVLFNVYMYNCFYLIEVSLLEIVMGTFVILLFIFNGIL